MKVATRIVAHHPFSKASIPSKQDKQDEEGKKIILR